MSTLNQFDNALSLCRDIFDKKLRDYGASWRIMRPRSITDQLYIKAKRIRTLEVEEAMIDEGILGEFMAIINYGLIGLIQLELGYADEADIPADMLVAGNPLGITEALMINAMLPLGAVAPIPVERILF